MVPTPVFPEGSDKARTDCWLSADISNRVQPSHCLLTFIWTKRILANACVANVIYKLLVILVHLSSIFDDVVISGSEKMCRLTSRAAVNLLTFSSLMCFLLILSAQTSEAKVKYDISHCVLIDKRYNVCNVSCEPVVLLAVLTSR